MTSLWPTGHEYATWDAAYVLGSLSFDDRREYEIHLDDCASCRAAIGELSGIPALLSRLDPGTACEIDAGAETSALSAPAPELLASLLTAVRGQRRRSRLRTWTTAAAAAVMLAVGVLVGVQGMTPPATPPQASTSVLPMAQVGTTLLASTVSVLSQSWGTYIDLNCVCLAPLTAHHDELALVVVGRDGSRTRLATWVAEPGRSATPAGSVSAPVDQIAAVQVVAADNDRVLLQRML